mgnify:CR=1 FL=1
MRFQVGDTVRIAKDCPYLDYRDADNPSNTDGKIREICWGEIAVDWDNGTFNTYDESDLRLRSRRATIPSYNPRVGENPFPRTETRSANWGETLQRGTQVTADDVWG